MAARDGVHASISNVSSFSEGELGYNWLLFGRKWGGPLGTGVSLTYSFVTSADAISYGNQFVTKPAFNSAQKTAATMALNAWSSVADIKFTQVADSKAGAGDIRWLNSNSADHNPTAFAYFPYSGGAEEGDIWIGPNPVYKSPAAGNYAGQTYMHELGHALGLKHPHDGAYWGSKLHDQLKYSVMSYRDHAGDSAEDGVGSGFFPTTPMLDDIAAIQLMYGKNMSFNSGNTTYSWAKDVSIYQTIWDGGGVDTIDAGNQSGSVSINLNAGQFSSIGKTFWNEKAYVNDCLAIAYGCVIENARGSVFDDNLTGNSAANLLSGNAGNDLLVGNNGNDTLNGGVGSDSMNGGAGNDSYYVDSSSDMIIGETSVTGIDTVLSAISYTLGSSSNLENLTLLTGAISGIGNGLSNIITGNAGNNTLNGGAGNDVLIGGAGKDVLTGSAGADRFDFNALSEILSGSSRDVISDFKSVEGDKIDLSTLDANTATVVNEAFSFIGTNAFTHAGQIRFANGILYGNTDADSSAEFEIQLTGVGSLTSSSFLL
ncbi:M10 family metallopeptidase [Chitinilyticum piscinae]|uniref:M10 family metallopeptidase n=1 Tax=Chitinilyticum piscinae TaxID=2866724 RepID=A0A8J7KFA1_9NEIS|nr:M10 family metallopeptidase [Chitinilyticum piscinae]MBE9609984.1 M10 family metallopeptidase [Chitinilyticum piscinae]